MKLTAISDMEIEESIDWQDFAGELSMALNHALSEVAGKSPEEFETPMDAANAIFEAHQQALHNGKREVAQRCAQYRHSKSAPEGHGNCREDKEGVLVNRQIEALRAEVARLREALENEVVCQTCEGTGIMADYCASCDAVGYSRKDCGCCHGAGRWEARCAECNGTMQSFRNEQTRAALEASKKDGEK